MTGESLIGPEALALVGTEVSRTEGTVVTKEFQRWAASVGDRNPLYFDPEAARSAGYRDVVMPPLYLSYVTSGVTDLGALRPDGIPTVSGTGVIPLPKCPRRMAGGNDLAFREPVYGGDVLTAARVLTELTEKHGRSGTFVLMNFVTTYTRQDGAVVATATASTIARPAS